MTGSLKLHPLEFLMRMAPLAAVQSVLYSMVTGELTSLLEYIGDGRISTLTWLALGGNGILAFLLNVTSFQTNKIAGALTMTICGNLKQCLTVALSFVVFHLEANVLNCIGLLTALAGAAWYSKVEFTRKASAASSAR